MNAMTRKPLTWGRQLAKLRKSLGLSQSRAAKRLGISPATLKNWEQDRTVPSLDLYRRAILRALRSPEEFS